MAAIVKFGDPLQHLWKYLYQKTSEALTPPTAEDSEFAAGEKAKIGQVGANLLLGGSKPEEATAQGMMGLGPAVIRPNFRDPAVIQALRRQMAAENRARGSVGSGNFLPLHEAIQKEPGVVTDLALDELAKKGVPSLFHIDPSKKGQLNELVNQVWQTPSYSTKTDPVDQLLRGPWYHGLRQEARQAIGIADVGSHPQHISNVIEDLDIPADKVAQALGFKNFKSYETKTGGDFAEMIGDLSHNPATADALLNKYGFSISDNPRGYGLERAFETGFPLSLHDSSSISNKLGEPAGVSLSALPSKSGTSFSPDQQIHRVMPLYGGQPTERVVNLMTPEGRATLNDAYDVVANQFLSKKALDEPLINSYGRDLNSLLIHTPESQIYAPKALADTVGMFSTEFPGQTGSFNKSLSEQLQSIGKRGILYNPSRWNEYEMLMLDPKYALPLDYRKYPEYNYKRRSPSGVNLIYDKTPGTERALQEIGQPFGPKRLGDIYQERPWSQRLNEENRRRLMELLDPSIKDTVMNQLGW